MAAQEDAQIDGRLQTGGVPRSRAFSRTSSARDDYLEVLAGHDQRCSTRPVLAVQQVGQILFQRQRLFRGQGGKRLVHRPVPGAEDVNEMKQPSDIGS